MTMTKTSIDFPAYLSRGQMRCNAVLEDYLTDSPDFAPRLLQATRYALLNGGKRVRPLLAYAAAEAVAGSDHHDYREAVDCAAAALEAIHSYSLVHDDLPAMDDDDLGRGQPTCHVQFDEATAILVGDGLQTLAFEWLAERGNASPGMRLSMIKALTAAAGIGGMVAGQAIDVAAEGQKLSLDDLSTMHRLKTGALIRASVRLGALAAGCATAGKLAALDDYAAAIGLAFQVQDDILDVVAETSALGKNQGSDAERNKPTYVSLLGLDGAREKARSCHEQALDALHDFDHSAEPLRCLSQYIVERSF